MADRVSPGMSYAKNPLVGHAQTVNDVLDATDFYLGQKALGEGAPGQRYVTPTDLVKVRNDVGSDLPRGSVVEFTDLVLDELDPANIWLAGDTPDGTNGYGILVQALPYGNGNEMGSCQVSGVCAALVNVTDTGHKFANVKSGSTVLESASSGEVRILYKPTGTGEKTCAVLLGIGSGAGVLLGITDAELTVDSSGTVSRYEGSTGTETDTGINDTVKNRMATVPSNRWVHYTQIDGVYYVIAARCTAITTTTTTTTGVPTTTTTAVPTTTTLAPTTTTLAPSTTTIAPTTTTADPTLWHCVVPTGETCGVSSNQSCVTGTIPSGYESCGGWASQEECEANCSGASSSTTTLPPSSTTVVPTSTTLAPTSTTLAPTSTTAGPTTAAPTTTVAPTTTAGPTSSTTAAPSQWFCVQMDPFCEGQSFCSQGVPEGYTQCGGPFPDNTCGGACVCCL